MVAVAGAAAPEPALDTFPRLLQHHARVRGGRTAMREKDLGIWQSWTWAQVSEETRAMAAGLAGLGFKRGDHLAIIGDNRPRLYWAMCAAQMLGGIPVPLYQDAVAQEMVFVLEDAEIKIAIVEDQEQVDKMLEIQGQCPALRHILYDDPRGMRHYTQAGLQSLDEAIEQKMTLWGQKMGQEVCAKNAITPTAGGWKVESECDFGEAGKNVTSGTVTGDFNSKYVMKLTTTTTGAKMIQANGTHAMEMSAEWKGACPADMKPGDMMLPGGMKMNIANLPGSK